MRASSVGERVMDGVWFASSDLLIVNDDLERLGASTGLHD
jgi:hypothetical protein